MGVHLLALAPEVQSGLLSVPGGRVSTIVEDGEAFAILIALMKPPDAEEVDVERFFPVLQTAIDATDPAVFASRAAHRRDLLQDMVLEDDIIPNACNRVLAAAMGAPIAGAVLQEVSGLGPPVSMPTAGNMPDGRTRALVQLDTVWTAGVEEDAIHSHVFDSDTHVQMMQTWARSVFEGGPGVIDLVVP
jgi:hypothetical protein